MVGRLRAAGEVARRDADDGIVGTMFGGSMATTGRPSCWNARTLERSSAVVTTKTPSRRRRATALIHARRQPGALAGRRASSSTTMSTSVLARGGQDPAQHLRRVDVLQRVEHRGDDRHRRRRRAARSWARSRARAAPPPRAPASLRATSGRWLSTLDAVAVDTPAARATTFSVARFLPRARRIAHAAGRYQVPKSLDRFRR